MKKRIVSCLVLLALCALPLSALADERETITLTVSGARNSLCASWEDLQMIAGIEERFGIVLECQEYSGEDWQVQKGLLFASGDIPDLFLSAGFSFNEAADYGSQGFLLPLNDLIEQYGENTKAVFEKNPALKRLATSHLPMQKPIAPLMTSVNGA